MISSKHLKRMLSLTALTGLLALVSCGSSDDDYYYYSGGYGGGVSVSGGGTTSSGGGSSSGGGVVVVDDSGGVVDVVSDPFTGWHDYYGNPCGNLGPGCNFHTDGYQIVDVEDPWWDEPDLWDNYFSDYYGEDVYESPSGVVYDYWGNALNKGAEIANGRDIITNKAEAEKKALGNQATYYSKKFGITQNQAMKLARTMNHFTTLQNRTANDIADFTKRLYGVNFSSLQSAVVQASQGDQSGLQDVLEDAASNFNITPESMKSMVKGLHGDLLKAAGIDLK